MTDETTPAPRPDVHRPDTPAPRSLPPLGNPAQRATLDQCVKCTICETACPVMAVTPLFPGPKFVGPQAERFRGGPSVDQGVDYCSSCGLCTLACPQGVRIAELNSIARATMKAEQGMPVRDRLITQTTLMGKAMTPVAPLANAVLGNKAARVVMEKVVGVHRDAPMPTASPQTLHGWLAKRPAPTRPAPRGPLVFFHGCAGGYFEVEAATHAIEVLEHLGYEVIVPKQGCCGLAQQSNGLFTEAAASVKRLVAQLRSAGRDLTIVSTAGSCTGMLKHEAHEILGVADADLADVGARIRELSEFLWELHEAGDLPVEQFGRLELTVPYHAPCQVKSQGMGTPASDVLRLIPGLTVVDSGVPCCGIAGTYGLKKEKYEIAQAVGQPLFDLVRATNPDLAVCDTETCRWQIEKSSGARTVHPITLVHAALGLGTLDIG
ncbi:MAG: anaerobic glycerol-3-phosphate dehydrogenase subunit C [Propionibacteriaceae bacterium]|nr:anaerobic glycerol-3-phosphate dehydrogenase subunit C [Propionibacteriaceae bacterium]